MMIPSGCSLPLIIKPSFGRSPRENSSGCFLVKTSPCRVFLLPFIRLFLPPPPDSRPPCPTPRTSTRLAARSQRTSWILRIRSRELTQPPLPPIRLLNASAAVLLAARTRRLSLQRLLGGPRARLRGLRRDRGGGRQRESRRTMRRRGASPRRSPQRRSGAVLAKTPSRRPPTRHLARARFRRTPPRRGSVDVLGRTPSKDHRHVLHVRDRPPIAHELPQRLA
ncbi:hypothetical protein C8Q80DRAFT_727002 [Daedaleopsis nitida]|nr:hypothetical protein C8Q80DRAFT_727002 [Daedaleopsis nitida]